MPLHVTSIEISRPIQDVFDFLARPANLLHLAPADMRLELVEGPDRLRLGSVMHWKARRMGISQALVNAVTTFEENLLIAEEQRHGPFKRWVFVHRFEATRQGTRIAEELVWEPPGGLLGLFVGADAIQQELDKLFAFRAQQLKVLLGP